MTPQAVIQMAQEAGVLEPIELLDSNQWRQDTIRELSRFAALVLEKAAQVCDAKADQIHLYCNEAHVVDCASSIRAMANGLGFPSTGELFGEKHE